MLYPSVVLKVFGVGSLGLFHLLDDELELILITMLYQLQPISYDSIRLNLNQIEKIVEGLAG